jgi:Na+/proline symporter
MIETAALPLVDWVVLGFYFAAMLGVGWYFYRSGRSSTAAGFTKADGAMPGGRFPGFLPAGCWVCFCSG